MSLTTIFWRPINLFRSQFVRAGSKHTSAWGLNLLSKKSDPTVRQTAISTLVGRLNSQNISVRSLYGFNPTIISKAIVLANAHKSADILSKAAKGYYTFDYIAENTTVVEDIPYYDNDGHNPYTHEETYTAPMKKHYCHYNLLWFSGLRDALPAEKWDELVQLITEKDFSLGGSLKSLDQEIIRIQEALTAKYPLPERYWGVPDKEK